ncbi:NAD(P)H-hydrate dehydratase, partial [Myxococcota bacterium]|nr:NAD(P)H-hydrate dehydratase [Myxococcota bacterium]
LKILDVPVCLDADALNLMSAHEDLSGLLKVPAVVTPHPREMARLLGCDIEEVQADRFSTAQEFAQQHNVVVVLKGAGTVVASPDGEVAVLESGSPALATGGTGDVLAGIIGALLAQGYEAFDAARAGVLLHALAGEEAARLHGESGVRAMDVVDAMGIVLLQHNR